MTEVKNLYEPLFFLDLIVNQNRAMQQLADPRSFPDGATHVRKASEQINVVQQRTSKAGGCLGVVLGNVADDFREIVQRPLRVEEAVIHWGKRLRTSSAGTVRPAAASRTPSSMAARVFSSSSSKGEAGLSSSSFFALAMLHDSPDGEVDATPLLRLCRAWENIHGAA